MADTLQGREMGEITEEHGPDNSPLHSRVLETGVDGGEGDRQRREEVEVADPGVAGWGLQESLNSYPWGTCKEALRGLFIITISGTYAYLGLGGCHQGPTLLRS